jgi:hypothetical protein
MKKILVLVFFHSWLVFAHDHVEVGRSGPSSTQLALDGPTVQVACFVPRGEFFSGYTPAFPGGWHASELTFTTETNALDSADGANPTIELVSVTGPAGGNFGFWEVDATSPTWSVPSGWDSTQSQSRSFPVVLNGDNHAHGRAFTVDKPGHYTVIFRAVDSNQKFSTSENYTITFRAQQPPQLSIGISGGNVSLSFRSRNNLSYDLQRCEDLARGIWTTIQTISGNGGLHTPSDSFSGRPKAFYRLVEY